MKMIPSIPYSTDSKAERVVFDRLKRAFNSDDDYVCFHSLNLTRHAKKRFGEIDFLLICPLGIFVLEVKGGRVACKDGVWEYTDKNNETDTSWEGPFRQAEGALHGLGTRMSEVMSKSQLDDFSSGYGVVLPDCELSYESSEWDRKQVCGKQASRDIEAWLRQLITYSKSKDPTDRLASTETLAAARQFLRPNFEIFIPLSIQAQDALEQISGFTDSQMLLVDSIELNRRIICEGGAGTGKTVMAVELAKRWTADGLTVAIVCVSNWLKNYLEENNRLPGLVISTFDGLKQKLQRMGIDKLDALIIDEAQDCISTEMLSRFDECLIGGLSDGRWCMFWDINNQSGMFGDPQQDAMEMILKANPQRVPLKRNCRNTAVILEKIQTSIAADVGVEGTGGGPVVREKHVARIAELGSIIDGEISELADIGSLSYRQITILTDEQSMPVLKKSFSNRMEGIVQEMDEYSIRSFPPNLISLCKVSDFKGLENDVIVFISPSNSLSANKVLSYVAMSRARAVLSIVYLPDSLS